MKAFKLTKLGTALALTLAVAAPLATALPASAHEFGGDRSYAQRYDGQRNDGQRYDGARFDSQRFDGRRDHRNMWLTRFDHRGGMDHGYADGREHARFQHYRWNWEQHGQYRFGR